MKELANKTLNVTEATKRLILSLKTHQRETIDDVIKRIAENYIGTQPE